MHLHGLLIGLFSFALIGIFHPIVIWTEYHFGSSVWPVFLICGLVCGFASLRIAALLPSALLAVAAFTFLWSIKELKEQEARVARGWFPANPKRQHKHPPKQK